MADKLILSLDFYTTKDDPTWFDEVKQLVKSEPTSTRRMGDKYKQGNAPKVSTENIVSYERTSSNLDDIGSAIDKLLDELDPDSIADIPQTDYRELAVTIYTTYANPGLHLSLHAINRLAKLKIELDIAIYATN